MGREGISGKEEKEASDTIILMDPVVKSTELCLPLVKMAIGQDKLEPVPGLTMFTVNPGKFMSLI